MTDTDLSWADALINAFFDFENFYFPDCPMAVGAGCDAENFVLPSPRLTEE